MVAVVIDQLSSETLLRLLPALDPDGLLTAAVTRGTFFERSVYPYINTLTAPGHAAIFTGAPPSGSGIGGNEEWDAQAGVAVPTVHSPGDTVFGHDGMTVGPIRLQQKTVAQMLKQQTGGAGKVVSLSFKDRAAVFSVGAGPDVAVWFDPSIGRFTTSSFCVESVPMWLTEHQQKYPVADAIRVWEPEVPQAYEQLLGPDAAAGEDSWWGATFPHDANTTPSPMATARLLPSLSEYMVDLAQAASDFYEMGQDDVPDLLVISISGTDYVGHTFGPHSWEYADHLRRADAALGKFVATLSAKAPTQVMITADHGVAPLPEHSQAEHEHAGRLYVSLLQPNLEQHLDKSLGEADWVAAIVSGFVSFTPSAKQRPDFPRALELSRQYLLTVEGIERVHTRSEALAWSESKDPEQQVVANSFPSHTQADLIIDTRRLWIFGFGNPPSTGTHHGSRHDYDQQVPLLFVGPGIAQRRQSAPVSQLRAAPTLAHLLGVPAPPGAKEPALDVLAPTAR